MPDLPLPLCDARRSFPGNGGPRTDQSLSSSDFAELTDWRRTVRTTLQATAPDRIVTGLGGHGVAACRGA